MAVFMPKLVQAAKGWMTGTWIKQMLVPAILPVEPYPTPVVMLAPPR
jgi:hypothetical protein